MRCDLFVWQLVVPADARGAAVSQNIAGCLGAFVLGFDQQELPTMRERHGVGFDNFVGQAIVGQMGLKSLDDSLVIWFSTGGRFGCSPNLRRSETGRKDQPETMRFSSDNPLIENGVFEASPRQTRNRLIHITGVVKYGDDRSHRKPVWGGDSDKASQRGKIFRLSRMRTQRTEAIVR